MGKNKNKVKNTINAKAGNLAAKNKENAEKAKALIEQEAKAAETAKEEKVNVEATATTSEEPKAEIPEAAPKQEEKKPVEVKATAKKPEVKKEAKVEAKTETPKETKKEPTKEAPKVEKKPQQPKKVKEEVIIPEVVTNTEEKKLVQKLDLVEGISKIANRERIDENHQIDFFNLLHKAYLDNPQSGLTQEQKATYQEVFDGGMCQLALILSAQMENEARNFILKGVEVTKEVYPMAKKQFLEMYGVETRALPGANDKQLKIEFENVPEDVKVAAKADAKAPQVLEIPKADPNMSEEQKLDVIRGILSRTNTSEGKKTDVNYSRMGLNVKDAIEWAKAAWEIKSTEPAAILATLYQKFCNTKTLCLTGFMNKAWGSVVSNDNPFIGHAIIYKDFAGLGYNDSEVSKLVRTMLSAQIENNFKSKSQTDEKAILSEIETFANIVKASSDTGVLNNIISKVTEIPIEIKGVVGGKGTINGEKVYNIVNGIYQLQDSPSLVRSKLEEITKLYTSPLARLANYADESAYSK